MNHSSHLNMIRKDLNEYIVPQPSTTLFQFFFIIFVLPANEIELLKFLCS